MAQFMIRTLVASFCAATLAACSPSVGNRRCVSNADCPAGTVCHPNGICFGSPDPPGDAGLWTDARFDAAALDALGADSAMPDAESGDLADSDARRRDASSQDRLRADSRLADGALGDDGGSADGGSGDGGGGDGSGGDGGNGDAQNADRSLSSDTGVDDGATTNRPPSAPTQTTWHIFPDESVAIDWSSQDPDGDAVTCALPADIAPLASSGWSDCSFDISYLLDKRSPPAGDQTFSVDVTIRDTSGASTSLTLTVILLDERGPYVDNVHQPGATTTWDAASDLGRCGARARPCADLRTGRSQLLSLIGDGITTDTALKVAFSNAGYSLDEALILSEIGMTCGYDSSNWDQLDLSFGRPQITYHAQYGIELGGSSVLNNCWIEGGLFFGGYLPENRAAVHVISGSPAILESRLIGDTSGEPLITMGLLLEGDAQVSASGAACAIDGGDGYNASYGALLRDNSSLTLSGCSINAGDSAAPDSISAGIYIVSGSLDARHGAQIRGGQAQAASYGIAAIAQGGQPGVSSVLLDDGVRVAAGQALGSIITSSVGIYIDNGALTLGGQNTGGARNTITSSDATAISRGVSFPCSRQGPQDLLIQDTDITSGSALSTAGLWVGDKDNGLGCGNVVLGTSVFAAAATTNASDPSSWGLVIYNSDARLTDITARSGAAPGSSSGTSAGAALIGSAFVVTGGTFTGGDSSQISVGLAAQDPQAVSTITGASITSGRVSAAQRPRASSLALWVDGSSVSNLTISDVTASAGQAPFASVALAFASGTTCHGCRVEHSRLTAGVADHLSAGLALTQAEILAVYDTTMQGGRARAGYSAGMFIKASCSGCLIMANKIFGGLAETGAQWSDGLFFAHNGDSSAGTTLITGNWIRGGQAEMSIGVDASGPGDSSVLYLLNTIQAPGKSGSGNTAIGVRLVPGSTSDNAATEQKVAVFAGNIVDVSGQAPVRYHFLESCRGGVDTRPSDGGANLFWPTISENNIDINDPTAYVLDEIIAGGGCAGSVPVRRQAQVDSQAGYGGSGNYFADPGYLASGDVHVSVSFNASLAESFNLLGGIVRDIDLSIRPQGGHMDVGCDEIEIQ